MNDDANELYYNVRPSIPLYENVQPRDAANVSFKKFGLSEAGGRHVLDVKYVAGSAKFQVQRHLMRKWKPRSKKLLCVTYTNYD